MSVRKTRESVCVCVCAGACVSAWGDGEEDIGKAGGQGQMRAF